VSPQPNKAEIAKAQASFQEQLDELDLRNVVIVDEDAFAMAPSQLRKVAEQGNAPELSDEAFAQADRPAQERSNWTREIFEGIGSDRQREIHGHHCRKIRENPNERSVTNPLDMLAVLAGDRYRPMLPEDWDALSAEEREDIALNDLVLFDQQLEGYPQPGNELMENLRASYSEVATALLTSTIDTSESPRPDFTKYGPGVLATGKRELNETPELFVDNLRLARAAPTLTQARAIVLGVAESAHAAALEAIANLDVRTIEEVVVHVASLDGIWEADALLRILEIVYRSSVRQRLLADDAERQEALREALAMVRTIYRLRKSRGLGYGFDEAQALMAHESYEQAEIINGAGLPLACGDIFEISSSPPAPPLQPGADSASGTTRGAAVVETPRDTAAEDHPDGSATTSTETKGGYWILTDQACDLQLRSNGRRTPIGGTDLVSVVPKKLKRKSGGLTPDVGPREYALDRFSRTVTSAEETGGDATECVPVAVFSSRLWVPYDVLELCVFDSDGRCQVDVSNETPGVVPQTPGMALRWRALHRYYTQLHRLVKEIDEPAVRAAVLRRERVGGNVDGTVLSWPIRRIERARAARAQAALVELAGDRARPAFDRDLL
jgi:hypothetical protein